MYYRKISAKLIFIFISVLYLGCSDDSITPSNSTVTGMVLNNSKIPVPGLKVKIGNESTVTNKNGFFSLKNSSYPYDILVIDEAFKSQLLIKSINMRTVIIPDFLTNQSTDNPFYIKVTLPPGFIHSGKKGKLIFTNDYGIYSSEDIVSENTVLEVKMGWYSGSNGKMIIITYLTDDSGNIISYENFFEKTDIVAIPDITLNFNIDSSQLSFNPVERNLTGKINIPPGYNSSQQYFYLNFASYNTSFNYPDCKFSLINGDEFNIIVPAELPSEYYIMINNYINVPGGDKYSLEACMVQKYSNKVILNAKLPADLISPAENAVDVTPQTEISHTPGEGSGVSVARFFKDDQIYSIITSSQSFLFSELSKFEIGEINNTNFFWTVQKYGDVPDLETYLTWYPSNAGEFVSKSEQRMFKTAP